MISIDVIQRSAQMLLPDLDGCYWVISIHENTHQASQMVQSSSENDKYEEKPTDITD